MRIILLGMGTVANAFCKLVLSRRKELKLLGLDPILVSAVDSRGAAVNADGLNISKLLEVKKSYGTIAKYPETGKLGVEAKEIIESVNGDLLVDLTPTNLVDGQPSLTHIRRALRLGMDVVTANKGPLAFEMPTLLDLAKLNGVALMFSATVGGATPFLSFVHKCLNGDDLIKIEAILNGTCNFILNSMEKGPGMSFDEALVEAQKLGYTEKDPSLDVDGLDTAAKLVILANWAMKRRTSLKDVEVKGIRSLTSKEIEAAKSRGRRIRLVGTIGFDHGGSNNETPSVMPTELDLEDPLCVQGNLNAVRFKARFAGNLVLTGAGAGGNETASAVLRDLLEIKKRSDRFE